MKEKQYFCDFIFSKSDFNFIRQCFFIIFFSFWIIIPISLIIYNNIIMSKYEYELNSYSEDTYKYITDIAKNAIQEGIGIDLNAIPEDIEYDILLGKVMKLYLVII